MSAMTLVGHDWRTYPRILADAVRCTLGRHRAVLHAHRDGITASVCSCGAARQLDRAGWHHRRSIRPRPGTPDLITGSGQW